MLMRGISVRLRSKLKTVRACAEAKLSRDMRDVRAPWGCRAYFCVFFGLHLRLCARLCVSFVSVKGLYTLLRPQWLPVAAPVSAR